MNTMQQRLGIAMLTAMALLCGSLAAAADVYVRVDAGQALHAISPRLYRHFL